MSTSQAVTTIVEASDSFIERALRDPSFDVEKLTILLGEQAKLKRELSRQSYFAAMTQVQAEIGQVVRDKANPHTRSRYATLEQLDGTARPVYTKYGFGLSYGSLPPSRPGFIRQSCTVAHRDGHCEQYELEGPVTVTGAMGGRISMNDMQAIGSAVAYLRRYLLMMIFNLVQAGDPVDDDGHAAAARRPRSGLMDQQARSTINEQKPENGNGKKKTVSQWFDEFQAECEAADTADECNAILQREQVMNCDVVFAKWPETVKAIHEVKEAMMKRIFQGDAGEPETGPGYELVP